MVSGLRVATGTVPSHRLSVDAVNALRAGNIDELLRLNRAEFGGFDMMAKDDDDDDDKPDPDDDDDDSSGDDDDDTKDKDDDNDDDDDSGDDDDDADDKNDKVSRAEYEKALKRMKAADRRAAEAEKAEKERKRKEMSDLDRTKEELTEAQESNTKLQSELDGLRLQNAFLAANKITWHDPDTALALAQSKGYLEGVADDDGVVDKKKLTAALKKLAKENQYLVKRGGSDASDDDDDDDAGDRGGRGSSGARGPGRSRNGKDKDAQKKGDARRAPSLGRRRPAVMGSRG